MSNRFRRAAPIVSVLAVIALLVAGIGLLFASTFYELERAGVAPAAPEAVEDGDGR
jgi:hypothetical protein